MNEPVCQITEKNLIRLAFQVAPNEIGVTSPKLKPLLCTLPTIAIKHICDQI